MLTSRERVLRAIEHKDSDRLPRDFNAEEPLTGALLRRLGGLDLQALKERFKIDLEFVGLRYNCPYSDGRNIYGIRWESAGDGATQNAVNHPLAEAASVEAVAAHAWPKPDWADLETAREEARRARASGRFVVCSSWGAIFGEAYRLMGMDNFMIALYERPDVVRAIVRKLTDFYLEVDRRLFQVCDGLIDMAYYGNDMGTQRALLFRREMFQEFFAPQLTEMAAQAKGRGLKTMMHSCGAVAAIIPDIIRCGFDALDPVQHTAEGMQPRTLREKYGAQITFHGGISAQRVLPLGTREDVRNHVREVCRIMTPGGGYIFSSDQAITPDTPVENVVAMYEAIEEFKF